MCDADGVAVQFCIQTMCIGMIECVYWSECIQAIVYSCASVFKDVCQMSTNG